MSNALDRLIQFPDRSSWLDGRRARGMGGSDFAAALGQSEFQSPHELWEVLTGRRVPDAGENKPWLQWGNDMEEPILRNYARGLPADLWLRRCSLAILPHPTIPQLFVSPDALLVRDDAEVVAGADGKNVISYRRLKYGAPETDEVPRDVMLQCIASCACADVDCWYPVASIGGQAPVVFEVRRDRELEEWLISEALEWYERHVIGGVEPEITDVEEAAAAVKARWPTPDTVLLEPTLELAMTMRDWLTARETEAAAKDEALRLATKLQDAIGPARGIRGLCSWPRSKDGSALDYQAMAVDLIEELRKVAGRDATEAVAARLLRKHRSPVPGHRTFSAARKDRKQALDEATQLIDSLSLRIPFQGATP